MNAPDKIYILCTDNGDLGDASLYPEGERSKEYIRKDALLEWAREGEMVTYGFLWEDFIDKLNSL